MDFSFLHIHMNKPLSSIGNLPEWEAPKRIHPQDHFTIQELANHRNVTVSDLLHHLCIATMNEVYTDMKSSEILGSIKDPKLEEFIVKNRGRLELALVYADENSYEVVIVHDGNALHVFTVTSEQWLKATVESLKAFLVGGILLLYTHAEETIRKINPDFRQIPKGETPKKAR